MTRIVLDQIQKPPSFNTSQSSTAQKVSQFSLTSQIQQFHIKIKSLKQKFLNSHFYNQFLNYQKTLTNELINPIAQASTRAYHQIPLETTKLKISLLQYFTFDQRFITLNAIALGTAVTSIKSINQYNAWITGIKTLRNTALTYLFVGLLIAPQIFNPWIQKDKNYEQNHDSKLID